MTLERDARRIVAAPILYLRGVLLEDVDTGGYGLSLEQACAALSFLFLLGLVLLVFAPETKGRELPE